MSATTTHNNGDRLEGQRALVTGATSGIGRAVALRLAQDGAEVIVHGRDAARGADVVTQIAAAGQQAGFVAADLGDPAGVDHLASEVGEIDVLVNNAGIALFGPTADLGLEDYNKLFASNVRAPFFLVAAFAPGMASRGRGSIISLSSMAGGVGLTGGAAYGGTKAALEGMTRAWQRPRSAGKRHRPRTGLHAHPLRQRVHHRPRRDHTDDRASQPEEIAEVIAFLASPQASYITGTTVAVDGGRRAV